MTKTTNYEISKKLAEIGFQAEAEKCWAKIKHSVSSEFVLVNLDFQVPQNCEEWVLSYDLETLLEFAFDNIENFRICNGGVSVAEFLSDYDNWHGHYKIVDNLDISIGFRETKISYANAIGQLIILLYEKNLIKF